MKAIITFISFVFFSCSLVSQSNDSIVYQRNDFKITKNRADQTFTIQNGTTQLDHLKFVKRVARYFQVLDQYNTVYFINEDWDIKKIVEDYEFLCGTVPHYFLYTEVEGDHFIVFEDETFYDYGNQIPAKPIHKIPKNEADEVLFINGKNTFRFDENFGTTIGNTNPKMIIIKKDNQYFTLDDPSLIYDHIDFTNHWHSLMTQKEGLYGILGSIKPQYKTISKFNYHLAKVTLVNGDKKFIDLEGNEY